MAGHPFPGARVAHRTSGDLRSQDRLVDQRQGAPRRSLAGKTCHRAFGPRTARTPGAPGSPLTHRMPVPQNHPDGACPNFQPNCSPSGLPSAPSNENFPPVVGTLPAESPRCGHLHAAAVPTVTPGSLGRSLHPNRATSRTPRPASISWPCQRPAADARQHFRVPCGHVRAGRAPCRNPSLHHLPDAIVGRRCSSEEIPSSFNNYHGLISRQRATPVGALGPHPHPKEIAQTNPELGPLVRGPCRRATERATRVGWLFLNDVRRRPTLPHPGECSTIGAEGLSFRVRNGTGRFPFAMTAVTLWRYFWGFPVRISGTAQWTRCNVMW